MSRSSLSSCSLSAADGLRLLHARLSGNGGEQPSNADAHAASRRREDSTITAHRRLQRRNRKFARLFDILLDPQHTDAFDAVKEQWGDRYYGEMMLLANAFATNSESVACSSNDSDKQRLFELLDGLKGNADAAQGMLFVLHVLMRPRATSEQLFPLMLPSSPRLESSSTGFFSDDAQRSKDFGSFFAPDQPQQLVMPTKPSPLSVFDDSAFVDIGHSLPEISPPGVSQAPMDEGSPRSTLDHEPDPKHQPSQQPTVRRRGCLVLSRQMVAPLVTAQRTASALQAMVGRGCIEGVQLGPVSRAFLNSLRAYLTRANMKVHQIVAAVMNPPPTTTTSPAAAEAKQQRQDRHEHTTRLLRLRFCLRRLLQQLVYVHSVAVAALPPAIASPSAQPATDATEDGQPPCSQESRHRSRGEWDALTELAKACETTTRPDLRTISSVIFQRALNSLLAPLAAFAHTASYSPALSHAGIFLDEERLSYRDERWWDSLSSNVTEPSSADGSKKDDTGYNHPLLKIKIVALATGKALALMGAGHPTFFLSQLSVASPSITFTSHPNNLNGLLRSQRRFHETIEGLLARDIDRIAMAADVEKRQKMLAQIARIRIHRQRMATKLQREKDLREQAQEKKRTWFKTLQQDFAERAKYEREQEAILAAEDDARRKQEEARIELMKEAERELREQYAVIAAQLDRNTRLMNWRLERTQHRDALRRAMANELQWHEGHAQALLDMYTDDGVLGAAHRSFLESERQASPPTHTPSSAHHHQHPPRRKKWADSTPSKPVVLRTFTDGTDGSDAVRIRIGGQERVETGGEVVASERMQRPTVDSEGQSGKPARGSIRHAQSTDTILQSSDGPYPRDQSTVSPGSMDLRRGSISHVTSPLPSHPSPTTSVHGMMAFDGSRRPNSSRRGSVRRTASFHSPSEKGVSDSDHGKLLHPPENPPVADPELHGTMHAVDLGGRMRGDAGRRPPDHALSADPEYEHDGQRELQRDFNTVRAALQHLPYSHAMVAGPKARRSQSSKDEESIVHRGPDGSLSTTLAGPRHDAMEELQDWGGDERVFNSAAFEDCVVQPLLRFSSLIDACSQHYLRHYVRVFEHLQFVGDTLLLGQGLFACTLSTLLLSKYGSVSSVSGMLDISTHTVAGMPSMHSLQGTATHGHLGNVLSASLQQAFPKGHEFAGHLSIELAKRDEMNPLFVAPVMLHYSPPFPVNVFLTASNLATIGKVGRFLLEVSCIKSLLSHRWMHGMFTWRTTRLRSERVAIRKFEMMRNACRHFVDAFHSHIMHQVIDCAWTPLIEAMKRGEAQPFEECRRLISAAVKRMERMAFLGAQQAKMLAGIRETLSIVMQLHHVMARAKYWDRSELKEATEVFARFQKCYRFLLSGRDALASFQPSMEITVLPAGTHCFVIDSFSRDRRSVICVKHAVRLSIHFCLSPSYFSHCLLPLLNSSSSLFVQVAGHSQLQKSELREDHSDSDGGDRQDSDGRQPPSSADEERSSDGLAMLMLRLDFTHDMQGSGSK